MDAVRHAPGVRDAQSRGVLTVRLQVQPEPDLRVGSDLVLKLGGRSTTWRVVGLVTTYRFDRYVGPSVFVERNALDQALGTAGSADTLQVALDRHDPTGQGQLATRVGTALEATGVHPTSITTGSARRAPRLDVANIILTFLVLSWRCCSPWWVDSAWPER